MQRIMIRSEGQIPENSVCIFYLGISISISIKFSLPFDNYIVLPLTIRDISFLQTSRHANILYSPLNMTFTRIKKK